MQSYDYVGKKSIWAEIQFGNRRCRPLFLTEWGGSMNELVNDWDEWVRYLNNLLRDPGVFPEGIE